MTDRPKRGLTSLLQLLLAAALIAGCGGAAPPKQAPAAPNAPAAQQAPAVAPPESPAPAAVAPAGLYGCLVQAPAPPADARRVKVGRVVDGDTIELTDGTKVRLIGINTPETVDPRRPVQAYGKEASDFTHALLEGQEILLQEGRAPRDKYGRTLAWLWLTDGRFVNALLVQQGYAQVSTYADNPDNADLLLACQREAREANRGLWTLDANNDGQQAASKGAPGEVTIVKAPGTVARNATAGVTVQTQPGAQCSISVIYKSGPSEARGLEPQQADGNGNATWSWTVGKNTSAGTWPVRVNCGGQVAETAITVR